MELNVNDVVLVNSADQEIGTCEKLEAHVKGLLHRAFSVFIFNDHGQLLLQRRAFGKYHSEGLWTNTCCSHQAPGESNIEAGQRRLLEEMGMHCELEESFSFEYRAELENALTEHELDHVLIGYANTDPSLNLEEAIDFKWIGLSELQRSIDTHPASFTAWLKIIMRDYYQHIETFSRYESLSERNI
jgi:isopentenyl-diphosphate delta-isomerase